VITIPVSRGAADAFADPVALKAFERRVAADLRARLEVELDRLIAAEVHRERAKSSPSGVLRVTCS